MEKITASPTVLPVENRDTVITLPVEYIFWTSTMPLMTMPIRSAGSPSRTICSLREYVRRVGFILANMAVISCSVLFRNSIFFLRASARAFINVTPL
ncbi:hypothetical protein D3C75_1181640 [compost metagenome]